MSKITAQHLYDWVYLFMKKHHLFPASGHAVVAFSGGEDSVLLYHVLEKLIEAGVEELQSLEAIHIDHGLRPESGVQAEELQRNYPDIKVLKISSQAPTSDIEKWARHERHALLRSFLKRGDRLYMGHHIDDSIEWYLRQLFGSSGTKKAMGIPLVNGPIMRPFHCLTKAQIGRFVKQLGLFFVYDPSNEDRRYQRNHIRHNILAELYKEFPKGQAHFVERANRWATKNTQPGIDLRQYQGMHIFNLQKGQGRWADHQDQIKRSIYLLGKKERGEIRNTLKKLVQSLDSGNGARGPLSFSGGVQAYLYSSMLILVSRPGLEQWRQWDQKFSQLLLISSQIPSVFKRKDLPSQLKTYLPFVFFKKGKLSFMGKKAIKGLRSDLIFPETTKVMTQLGYSFRPLSFLEKLEANGGERNWEVALLRMNEDDQ